MKKAYKIIRNKTFTEDEDSLFKKIEEINTHWGTVYSRDLAEFTKEEIIEMCPKDVVDICMLDGMTTTGLLSPPIIELELQKHTLDPHIII